MHFRCVFTLLLCYVLVGLDWAEPMMYLNLHVICSCIFMHTYPSCFYVLILNLFGAFLIVYLSLFLTLVASWHLNVNPFRPGTLFVSGHLLLLLLLTPFHLMYSSIMKRPSRTSQRTFHDEAFIRNTKSFC